MDYEEDPSRIGCKLVRCFDLSVGDVYAGPRGYGRVVEFTESCDGRYRTYTLSRKSFVKDGLTSYRFTFEEVDEAWKVC